MTGKRRRDYFITVPDDGLLAYEVGPWAEDKYRRVGMYAEMFATGMKNLWDRRVYLDLFAGPGHARVRGTTKVVLGSPMIALQLPDRFDRYVFADEYSNALNALKARVARVTPPPSVSFIPGDVNAILDGILEEIPKERRTLSFCFLDPYRLNIQFDTVRRLADRGPVDFLILLALYVDANRNERTYVEDTNETIDAFLGDSTWRETWEYVRKAGLTIVEFLAKEYASRMVRLGYLPVSLDRMVKVRTHNKRLPLYYLAFFSRHKKGLEFWDQVLKYSDDQLGLGL
ncbi:MAG: hypothetical protein AUI33_17360 [Ignavibacteria bacterium 13_1_40CM_2_61_4]|nr:MAG: hypothetical protein AUI33_17360 [Ignavibacteria bacterium 13_1_40CM_2_61_4]